MMNGSHGEHVKEVQQALGIPADGYFGPQTMEAVKKYQTAQNLPVDGIVGPQTLAKLLPSAEKKEEDSPRRCGRRRWITKGSYGEHVKELQQALGIPADGYFGPQTEEAVKKYQTAQNLPVDGIVGPRTWSKLFPSAETKEEVPAPAEKKETTVTPTSEKPVLRRGAVGDAVREVQRAVGVYADGSFGGLTERAVKDFQFSHDLPVDGIVGPRTWVKIAEAKPALSADPLAVLAGMGFTNVELNTRLLKKHNGDVEQVVAEIFGSQ